MKKYKNGVPMLDKSAFSTIVALMNKGIAFDAGTVAVTLNPKFHRRGRKLKVIEVSVFDSRTYVWYHGYRYVISSEGEIAPLNLRDMRVIRFYQLARSLKKKNCKNLRKHIHL